MAAQHIATDWTLMDHEFPPGYRCRPYAGPRDHAAMAAVLSEFNLSTGDGELVTTEQLDLNYAQMDVDELVRDVVIVEHDTDGVVGYGRAGEADTPEAHIHYWVAPLHPAHLARDAFLALVAQVERRSMARVATADRDPSTDRDVPLVHRCWMPHPPPGEPIEGAMVAWLYEIGYRAVRFAAGMVRPLVGDLADAIADLPLPDGVEVRPAQPEHLRAIWDADVAAFAGSFGAEDATDEAWIRFRDEPMADLSMWKVAWHGDQVVGQVRSYVNHDENRAKGRLRGYTEHISTRADWRSRGLASALLAASLFEVRDRGMEEAALGVDIENPAGALSIYARQGFRVTDYQAVLDKPITVGGGTVG